MCVCGGRWKNETGKTGGERKMETKEWQIAGGPEGPQERGGGGGGVRGGLGWGGWGMHTAGRKLQRIPSCAPFPMPATSSFLPHWLCLSSSELGILAAL